MNDRAIRYKMAYRKPDSRTHFCLGKITETTMPRVRYLFDRYPWLWECEIFRHRASRYSKLYVRCSRQEQSILALTHNVSD